MAKGMAMGGYREAKSPASKGKRLHHLEVREGESGGHIVTLYYHDDGMMFHRPVDHVFSSEEGNEALSHIAHHANIDVAGRGGDGGEELETEYGRT